MENRMVRESALDGELRFGTALSYSLFPSVALLAFSEAQPASDRHTNRSRLALSDFSGRPGISGLVHAVLFLYYCIFIGGRRSSHL